MLTAGEKNIMEEIGRRLRQKRIEKNLSVEEVNLRTRIPVKFLKDMEEGNYARFYAEVYYTGSLRKYARFLGLDEDELIALYHARTAQAAEPPAPHEKEAVRRGPDKKIVYAVLVSLAIIAAAVFFISQITAQRREAPQKSLGEQQPAPSPENSTPAPQGSAAPSAVPQSTPDGLRSVPADVNGPASRGPAVQDSSPGQGLTLEIRAVHDSWLRITADNKKIFEGILTAGNSRRWTADQRYDIIIGYVPGVEAALNGRTVNVRKGSVKDVNQITLTRETLQNL